MNCTPPLILRELYTIPKYRKTKPLTSVRRIDLGTTNISKCLSRILTPKVANTIAHTETSRDFVRGIIPKAYEIIVLLFIFPHRRHFMNKSRQRIPQDALVSVIKRLRKVSDDQKKLYSLKPVFVLNETACTRFLSTSISFVCCYSV